MDKTAQPSPRPTAASTEDYWERMRSLRAELTALRERRAGSAPAPSTRRG